MQCNFEHIVEADNKNDHALTMKPARDLLSRSSFLSFVTYTTYLPLVLLFSAVKIFSVLIICISSAQKGAAVICRYNFLFTQQNLPPTSLTLVLFEICTFCTLWICFSSIREFWFGNGQQLLSKTFYGKIIQGPCTKFITSILK